MTAGQDMDYFVLLSYLLPVCVFSQLFSIDLISLGLLAHF